MPEVGTLHFSIPSTNRVISDTPPLHHYHSSFLYDVLQKHRGVSSYLAPSLTTQNSEQYYSLKTQEGYRSTLLLFSPSSFQELLLEGSPSLQLHFSCSVGKALDRKEMLLFWPNFSLRKNMAITHTHTFLQLHNLLKVITPAFQVYTFNALLIMESSTSIVNEHNNNNNSTFVKRSLSPLRVSRCWGPLRRLSERLPRVT